MYHLMPQWWEVTAAGAVIGVLFGLFGVGGSSFATPVLGLLGVPGLIAVAAPLPATIPAAIAGAMAFSRRGEVDRKVARWSIIGGVPAAIIGALLSGSVGGNALLIASGEAVVEAAGLLIRQAGPMPLAPSCPPVARSEFAGFRFRLT